MTEASQGARSVWAGQSLEAQNLCSGLCCVSVEVASGHTGTLERVSRDLDCHPSHPFRAWLLPLHPCPPCSRSLASFSPVGPLTGGGGTVLSHAATADPSTQTLGTPPTGPSLPPLMYSSLPGCLAMEPRLPDLASVSLGEGWGAGLLEPLRRERLASGWVAVDSIRTLGWSEGWAPQPAGASSLLGDCSDRGATGKARLRGL